MIAALAIVLLLGLLALFQLALASGAPWGRLAWGGQHRVLPARQRVGSVVSVALYVVFAVIVLAAAGALAGVPPVVARVGIWVVLAVFALGILANAASKSRPERAVMTPVNAVLAVLTLLVAVAG